MKTETICTVTDFAPQVLLNAIECNPDTFTPGRRNNDFVNWFIAKRLVDMAAGDPTGRTSEMMEAAYEHAFKELLFRLTTEQRFAIEGWNESWTWKIHVLVEHYWRMAAPQLHYLWLPMDYTVQRTPENQTTLPMEV